MQPSSPGNDSEPSSIGADPSNERGTAHSSQSTGEGEPTESPNACARRAQDDRETGVRRGDREAGDGVQNQGDVSGSVDSAGSANPYAPGGDPGPLRDYEASSNPGRDPTDSGGLSRRQLLQSTAATGGLLGLSGCIYLQSAPSGKTVVQMAADSGTAEAQPKLNKALHDAGMPEDIQVEVIVVGAENTSSQFTQWLSAGLERPSLLRMDSGWTIPFILRQQVANLSEKLPDVAKQIKENYFEATVNTITSPQGDVFGVPMFSDFGLMLYRKDLVEKAGFDPSGWATSPLTWQKFSEVAKKTKEQTNTKYGFTFQADIYEGLSCCTFNEFMTTWGGSYFGARKNLLGDAGNRPVTVTADPVKNAAGMVKTFIQGTGAPGTTNKVAGSISPAAVLSWQESTSLAAFTDKNAVMHRNWPYSILEAGAEEVFGKNLGVMPIPYGVEPNNAKFAGMGGSKSALGGWHVTLNPNARHEDAALEVLKAMTADSYYLTQMEALGFVPPKPALLDSQKASQIPVIGRYTDQLKYAGNHAIPRPVTVLWPLQSPRIAQQVSAALSGDKPIQQAMNDLERILKQTEQKVAEER